MGMPFLEGSGDLLTVDTKMIKSKEAVQNVFKSKAIVKVKFSEFVKDTVSTQKIFFGALISKNKLTVFSVVLSRLISNTKQPITSYT